MQTSRATDATRPAPWWSLRRITSGAHYLPSIDGLRFLAILAVILFHIAGQVVAKRAPTSPPFAGPVHLGLLTMWGGFGVRLFFVISGFILALPYARARFGGRRPPTLRAFYLRRLTRLEPPYVLNLLVLFPLTIFFAREHPTLSASLPHLFAHLTYTNNLYGLRQSGSINPVTWSLEVELQFYLLVPLIMRVFLAPPAKTRRILVAGVLLFSALDLVVHPRYPWVENFLPDQAQFFLTGVLLGDVYTSREDRDRPLWDGLAALALVMAVPLLAHPEYPALLVVPMGLAVYAALASRHFSRLLAFGPFAIIGGMCYTVYLWHFFVIAMLWRVTARLSTASFDRTFLTQCALLLPAILLVSAALFVLVERPCMDRDWPAKVWRLVTHRRAPQDVQPIVPPSAPEIVEEP